MSKSTSNFLEILKVGLHGFSALLKGLDFGDGSGLGLEHMRSGYGLKMPLKGNPQ